MTLWTVSIPDEGVFSFERPASTIGDRRRAKICPQCLKIWATLGCFGTSPFEIDVISCAECNYSNSYYSCIPGSLLACDRWFDEELLQFLPEPLVRRELLLTLKATENDPNVANFHITCDRSPDPPSYSIGGI